MTIIHMIDDWDLTHTRFHTQGRYQVLSEKDLVSAYLLREKVLACYYGHHYFSIGTHGESREMIWETLINVCKLTEEEASSVAIINIDERTCSDKSIHIKRGLEYHKLPMLPGKGPLFERYSALTVITDDIGSNAEFAANEGAVFVRVNSCHDTDGDCAPLDDEHLQIGLAILKQPHMARDLAKAHAEKLGYAPSLKETQRIFLG